MRRTPSSNSIYAGPWDVVVIGAGAAGLMTCLELPDHLKVLLLNRNASLASTNIKLLECPVLMMLFLGIFLELFLVIIISFIVTSPSKRLMPDLIFFLNHQKH